MIRSRKDEGTSTITSSVTGASPMIVLTPCTTNNTNTNTTTTVPSPAAFRYQRTSSNVGTTASNKTAITPSTPTIKRNNSSMAIMGVNNNNSSNSKDDNTTAAVPSATAVSSFANTATSSVSSSLQYYNNLIQHQMYNLKKGRHRKKSKHHSNDSNIWTVQMPRRMVLGTMGIFLLIPMILFVYKELHLPSMDEQLLRGNQHHDPTNHDGTIARKKKANRNQEYVTWMANFLTNEEVDEEEEDNEGLLDSADIGGAMTDLNETIHNNNNYDGNRPNETTGGLDHLFFPNTNIVGEDSSADQGMTTINDDHEENEEEMDASENDANH